MGVQNIQILIEHDNQSTRFAQAAHEEGLIEEHRRGKHPWGSMRRDCPLCQQGKELIQR